MAEKLSVICDVHKRDHPATHMKVPVDMCDLAYEQHQARISGASPPSNGSSMVQRDADNNELLNTLARRPGLGRAKYAEILQWDVNRVSSALGRLKARGFARSKGKAQLAVWNPTASGRNAATVSNLEGLPQVL